jgi:hypothetical protein
MGTMLHIKPIGFALALATATAALGADTASAKKYLRIHTPIENEQEVPILIPSRVFLEGDIKLEAFTTAPPSLESPVECSGGLDGELESNDQSKDQITIIKAYAGLDGECDSHEVSTSGFPWTLTLGATGRAKLAGVLDVTLDSCAYSGRWTTKLTREFVNGGPSEILQVRLIAERLRTKAAGCQRYLRLETSGYYGENFGGTFIVANAAGELLSEVF